ncbi:MAG: nucleotidyltransferase domain-containing protein [Flavobacteriales bacterium]|jgi:predicted nucleotidyltransferase|nr:nucleotidyltransferase domain-containing protein [Flavobacteriales bacterium]MBK7943608.1 nucleotidyltransferase domain-containing protein [Flavobacteriales bacterium]MBK8950582.1 nucleotidyltransferase domain-containing protein [Flavobacteriales bacterium]MBK9699709.1 nucleotidyltransferase domain-containing protein [Flavobacteriales bacterium]
MLDLHPDHRAEVRRILAEQVPGAKAWAFGSRVKGTARPFSDLDLAIDAGAELDLATLAELRHAFQESDLPISVDLLDLRAVRPAIKRRVRMEQVPI